MKFQVGQKVSFLNEARNGIVTKIINSQMVQVATDDGFEYPIMASELVPNEPMFTTYDNVEDIKPTPNTKSKNKIEEEEYYIEDEEEVEIPRKSTINIIAAHELERGYHIAFAAEENNVNADFFYIYFINNSDNDAIFTYALKNEEHIFIDKDFEDCPAKSKVILEVISREQFEEWSTFNFQIITFSRNNKSELTPINCEVEFSPIKLFKGQNFKYYKIIEETAWIKTLYKQIEIKAAPIKNGLKIVGHINDVKNKDQFPEKHIVAKDIAEVDLHIDELIDNIEGLTNAQMLANQTTYFRNMLNLAIENHFKRIIFIHGIGNGKLKTVIREILASDYPFLEIFDASIAKYGAGATEIRIPVNTPLI